MNVPVLAGKTALITGASRGIGLGITQSLARNGVSCILLGRDIKTLDAQIAELPGRHSRLVGDVASIETWTKFEAETVCLVYAVNCRMGALISLSTQRVGSLCMLMRDHA